MENNETNVTNSPAVDSKFIPTVDIGFLIAGGAFVFTCLWIITLNGLLILCFWINKRENWYSQSKNILSITIIDLLVGLTALMAFFGSIKINIDLYECLVEYGLCMASQTATSLNVLRFSMIRFYSTRKTSVVREPSSQMVVLQTLGIWILSSVIVLVPLVLWAEKQSVLKQCGWTYMFVTHELEADIYMFNVLTLPTVTTTVLYGVLTVRLRKVKNCVNPSSTVSSVSHKLSPNSGLETKTTFLGNKSMNSDTAQAGVEMSNENVCQISVLPSAFKGQETDSVCVYGNTASSNPVQSAITGNFNQSKVQQANQGPTHTVTNHLAVPNTTTSKPAAMVNRRTRMNKVIATIGILLVMINITNLPYIIITAMNAVKPEIKVSALVSLLALLCLMLNSACNPIIYAVRLEPLRIAFFKMIRECCQCINKITCCKNNS